MRIDREAWPFASVAAAAALLAGLWHPLAALPPLVALAFVVWFFRDPPRTPPGAADALISPADGRIIQAGPRTVSVFMNVFDVHVCRAPAAGVVAAVEHSPGRFLAAWKDEAPVANERATITLEQGGTVCRFTLVAGLVARRIVCRVRPGQTLAAGERVGLIRFGSRVDLELPEGATPEVRIGQRVVAGETPLARLRRPRER
jgi:phosphatidylserine decarboxylase